jgi:hypothetical protein
MKIAIAIVVVVVVVAVVAVIVAKRRQPGAELTPSETKIRDLVREVYAGNIVSERLERNGSDAVLVAELQNEKLKELKINLSSLARKHEQEGLSLPVIKMSLRFD